MNISLYMIYFFNIYYNSKYFKYFKNKKLYWIYLVQNDPLKDELLPDEMKESCEQEINVIKNISLNVSSDDNNINNNNENFTNKNSWSFNNSTFIIYV